MASRKQIRPPRPGTPAAKAEAEAGASDSDQAVAKRATEIANEETPAPPAGQPPRVTEDRPNDTMDGITTTVAPAATSSSRFATPEFDVETHDPEDPYLGMTIDDRYVVDAVIGEGGMGRVYRAHHIVIGKKVAIKVLRPEHARDREAVGRFIREAQTASSVGNPHIVDVSDFGDLPNDAIYFVMEHLEGRSLGDLIDAPETASTELICHIAAQIAEGVAAAHEKNVIHRDLKPDNILLIKKGDEDHFCKILDFGIAKVSAPGMVEKLTLAGAVFGTPHYMSPEQAAGTPIDHRSDIYSLGVILFEMATGAVPFHADTYMGILTQHLYKAAPNLSESATSTRPEALNAIVHKCMAKKASERYQTMTDVAADLVLLRDGAQPTAIIEASNTPSDRAGRPEDYFGTEIAGELNERQERRPRTWLWVAAALAAASAVGLVALDETTADAGDTLKSVAERVNAAARRTEKANPASAAIVVACSAKGATIMDGNTAHPSPYAFALPVNEQRSVVVAAPGKVAKTVTINEASGNLTVLLEAEKVGAARRKTNARATPRPSPRPKPITTHKKPRETVNPWGK